MDINLNSFLFDINNISSVTKYTNNILQKSEKNYKKILESTNDTEILSILTDDINMVSNIHSFYNLLSHVSNNNIKNKYYFIVNKLNSYNNDLYKDKTLYNKLQKIKLSENSHEQLFVQKILDVFIKNGIELSENELDKLNKTKNKIKLLEQQLLDEINKEENKTIGIKLKTIESISQDVIDTFPIINNKPLRYGINLSNDNYKLLIKNISEEKVRKKLYNIYNYKCIDKLDILTELILERNKLANLLSYDNFLKLNMSKQSINDDNLIKEMIFDIIKNTDDKFKKEYDMISKIKKKYENSSIINKWDIDFYLNKWKKLYKINDKQISEFFPLSNTLQEMLKLLGDIFDIKIKKKK